MFGHHTLAQVSGLPTNQEFLKRLAVHPAFIAAELDTSFIQKHHASLVDAQPLPQHVVALAAVADHLLQVQQVSACKDMQPTPLYVVVLAAAADHLLRVPTGR